MSPVRVRVGVNVAKGRAGSVVEVDEVTGAAWVRAGLAVELDQAEVPDEVPEAAPGEE